MSNSDSTTTITSWLEATNSHRADAYLAFFTKDAVLDDPSVGEVFKGRSGIKKYYDSYFIGYNTQTELVSIEPRAEFVHVEVNFTGDFPGGQTGGIFDMTFAPDGLISHIRADLT